MSVRPVTDWMFSRVYPCLVHFDVWDRLQASPQPCVDTWLEDLCINIHFFLIQLVSFGLSNEMVVTFKEENLVSFKHVFLKGYSDRITDTYTVYTKDDVYDHILFIADQVC